VPGARSKRFGAASIRARRQPSPRGGRETGGGRLTPGFTAAVTVKRGQGGQQPVDVLVGRAQPDADPDRRSPVADHAVHQQVGAEPAIPDPDAVVLGQARATAPASQPPTVKTTIPTRGCPYPKMLSSLPPGRTYG
jgi:hypothetical protein